MDDKEKLLLIIAAELHIVSVSMFYAYKDTMPSDVRGDMRGALESLHRMLDTFAERRGDK